MSDWTCRCSARNDPGWSKCEGCGRPNPQGLGRPRPTTAPLPKASKPRVVPLHPLAVAKTYPLLTEEEAKLIEAERAKIKALFATPAARRQAPPDRPMPLRVMLPPIDPAVRRALEERAATLSDRTEPPDLKLPDVEPEVPEW